MTRTTHVLRVCARAVECNQTVTEQDHQALLEAKYCPRVAAAKYTENNKKTHVTLTYDLEKQ